jgi:enoyl-CoA hydratase
VNDNILGLETMRLDVLGLETMRLDVAQGVAVVTIDRPPVNAVNRRMQLELTMAFEHISQRRDVNSAVLAADGKVFCAGIDLHELGAGLTAVADQERSIRAVLDAGWEWRQAQAAIRHCSVPTIAAVEGAAIGAGFGMVGVCDLVVASRSATFGLTEINVGLLGGASKAIKMVGAARARRMMFTGVKESAEEFYRLGGVDELVEQGQALDRAMELGRVLAEKSPLALRLAKESILRIEGDELEERYRTEQDYTTRMLNYTDAHEALAAFMERREATWTWS